VKFPQKNNENLRSLHYFKYTPSSGVFAVSFKKHYEHNAGKCQVFLEGGSAVIFHTCPNHCLISSVSKGESKDWHIERTCQVLHYIRSILFLPVFSKSSRMKEFLQSIPTCL